MLFLTLGLIMAWTDIAFFNGSFSHQMSIAHQECTDFSDHSEISDHHGSEDYILECGSGSKSVLSQNDSGLTPFEIITVKYSYISFIWQPPKFV